MVFARSLAEIPVVTPFPRRSILTVKAVWWGSVLRCTMGCKSNSLQRDSSKGVQINPRPCFAIKLMVSGVISEAAATKSPSFSRSASSTTKTILPAANASKASSIRFNSMGSVTGADAWFSMGN